jgi:multicomponent K+:H+ antiporter subunit D
MWPLCFWLPGTYAASTPPAGALFAVLSKVGVYAVLRTGALFLGADVQGAPSAGTPWLVVAGAATLVFGAIGLLASQNLSRLASYCVLVSSGTLLAAVAIGEPALTGAALYYLVVSTLALSAFFLLVELVERGRRPGSDVLAVTAEAFKPEHEDDEYEDVGRLLPAATALLGVAFAVCAIVIAGLPPLSGFIGKFAMLDALFESNPVPTTSWTMLALLLASGLATIVAMARAGVRRFWTPPEVAARVRVVEIAPIAFLLLLCVGLTIGAREAMRYLDDAARDLHAPQQYVHEVLGSR